MKCRQVQKKLSAFQDGELKPLERERVSEHLGGCSACRERYAELERVWQALEDFKEILPEPGFYGRLVKKINESNENRFPVGFQWLFQFFSSAWATSILLVVGILAGTFLGNMLAKSDLFPFQQSQAVHPQAATEVFSLRVFSPIPPGTLGDKYLRMATYGEEVRR
ncbi:MAG: zf-HC2 domain-containing protein [Deltaproteobacteria bacterium]|nr:zf-HC2 domain-containing protein [Deltaproteobacteria bacterium]